MKVTVQMNVYNAEDYLAYSLGSIYKFADRIVIIDGAFNKKMPSLFSTDRTEKIVKDFPDEDGKIVYLRTSSKNQVEQRNKVWPHVIGDWLFLVDHDEVYKEDELVAAKEFLSVTDNNAFWVQANVFLNSCNWYFTLFYPRIFRLKEGIKFIAPNFFVHTEGKYVARRDLPAPKLIMSHYSFVENGKRVPIKREQRKLELTFKNIRGKYKHWNNRLHVDFQNGFWIVPKAWRVKKFEGVHPLIMENHPFRNINKDWQPSVWLEEERGRSFS